MKKILSLIVMISMVLFPAFSFAFDEAIYKITYMPDGNNIFSVMIADEWEIDLDGKKVTGISQDGLVWFTLGYLEGYSDLEEAISYASEKLENRLTDLKLDSASKTEINHMPAIVFEGTGKEEGKDIIYLAVLFKTFDNKICGMAFVGDPIAKQLHNQDVVKILNSLTSS